MSGERTTVAIGPVSVTMCTEQLWIHDHLRTEFSAYVTDDTVGMEIDLAPYADVDINDDSPISVQKHGGKLTVKRGDFTAEYDLYGKSGRAKIVEGSVNGLNTLLKFAFALSALNHDGFFIHSAAVKSNGFGIVFPGKSGIGKTTLIRKINNYSVMTDEFALIVLNSDRWELYSTPFHGELNISHQPQSALLKKVMFLERNGSAGLTEISPAESMHQMLRNIRGSVFRGRR